MLDHVSIQCADLAASAAFLLKLKPEFHLGDMVRDWKRMDQDLWGPPSCGSGVADREEAGPGEMVVTEVAVVLEVAGAENDGAVVRGPVRV